jgi:endoglucanase
MFSRRRCAGFDAWDFDLIAEWGFDFVRLPLCYRLWLTDPDDPAGDVDEAALAELDRAVDLGRDRGLHVCINFHHAPGYCINHRVREPGNLWKEPDALDAFCRHWELMARRYRGRDPRGISFNLVNEPPEPDSPAMSRADHERVMRTAIDRIRRIDPDRLIVLDGLAAGRLPCPELTDTGAAQSCRGYHPLGVSHYKARWVHRERWPTPTWPGAVGWYGQTWDRSTLEHFYAPWRELMAGGVGVHCGEGGCYNRTPHDVFLRWFREVLEILTPAGIGWALWNLRGPFGVLDSGRDDVDYEPFRGHRLDRKLLDLLREF